MNYEPFIGYWFYGASSAPQRAVYFASYGLLTRYGGPFPPPLDRFPISHPDIQWHPVHQINLR
jgi:hypothetical protein